MNEKKYLIKRKKDLAIMIKCLNQRKKLNKTIRRLKDEMSAWDRVLIDY